MANDMLNLSINKEMERDKARQQAAKDYCHNLISEGTFGEFMAHKAGSKWADEHPVSYDGKAMLYVNNKSHENGYKEAVNKACEWLKDYAHMFVSETTGDLTEDELINAFRKEMKGEQT